MNELSHDLATFVDQWNNRLTPLTSTLPNQSGNDVLDAFADGLDGKTLYVDSEATAVYHSSYYNASEARPYSIYEQLDDIYDTISTLESTLEAEISAFSLNALQISIADTGGLYTATNVENALSEVMTAVNAIATGALDLSAVAQHYLPATDNFYTIGTSSKRLKDVFVGPSSLRVISKTGDTANSVNKTYTVEVNTAAGADTGKLEIKEGGSTLLQLSSAGAAFPTGFAVDLDDLGDVSLSSPTSADLLRYTGSAWANAKISSSQLTDVSLAGIAGGDTLVWGGLSFSPTHLPDVIDDLSDVSAGAPSENQILRYLSGTWTADDDLLWDGSINELSFYTAANTISGSPNLIWDIATSRLGIHEASPSERLSLDGVLALAGQSPPSATAGYGKIWYDTTSGEFHQVDAAGTESVIAPVSLGADRSTGDIPYFESGLLMTSSGLTWDATNQSLGIGTDSPNAVAGLDLSNAAGPLLMPRYTQSQINALSPIEAMVVYNTTSGVFQGYTATGWQNL